MEAHVICLPGESVYDRQTLIDYGYSVHEFRAMMASDLYEEEDLGKKSMTQYGVGGTQWELPLDRNCNIELSAFGSDRSKLSRAEQALRLSTIILLGYIGFDYERGVCSLPVIVAEQDISPEKCSYVISEMIRKTSFDSGEDIKVIRPYNTNGNAAPDVEENVRALGNYQENLGVDRFYPRSIMGKPNHFWYGSHAMIIHPKHALRLAQLFNDVVAPTDVIWHYLHLRGDITIYSCTQNLFTQYPHESSIRNKP